MTRDHGGEPARDGGGRMHQRGARCTSAVGDLVPPGELAHPEAARDGHLVRRLHLEHRHAVDFLALETGVLERELDRLDGGIGDRPPDVPGERQVADAHHGHLVLDAAKQIAVEPVGHDVRLARGLLAIQTSGLRWCASLGTRPAAPRGPPTVSPSPRVRTGPPTRVALEPAGASRYMTPMPSSPSARIAPAPPAPDP